MKYVDPSTIKVVDLVKDNKKVRFAYYRDHEFWYEHEDGLKFPIPLKDTEGATFNAEDRAFLFLRWMKKYIETAKETS